MKCQDWQREAGLYLNRFDKGAYEVCLHDSGDQVIGEVHRRCSSYIALDIIGRFLGRYRTRKQAALAIKEGQDETI